MKMTVSPPAKPSAKALVQFAPEMADPHSFYTRASMMKALLDPLGYGAEWRDALRKTLAVCDHVDPRAHLGFPAGWDTRPAWL
ncbi:hypothetical protein [Burkholderia pyrrocinia]|uniref:hypothetical protein n=1 Tax=Burkholderia pyrrocinia TaxID=60550 RepID=UPI001FB83249|nr:hypothetical protein [Burkholderia pyrrocinia]